MHDFQIAASGRLWAQAVDGIAFNRIGSSADSGIQAGVTGRNL